MWGDGGEARGEHSYGGKKRVALVEGKPTRPGQPIEKRRNLELIRSGSEVGRVPVEGGGEGVSFDGENRGPRWKGLSVNTRGPGLYYKLR